MRSAPLGPGDALLKIDRGYQSIGVGSYLEHDLVTREDALARKAILRSRRASDFAGTRTTLGTPPRWTRSGPRGLTARPGKLMGRAIRPLVALRSRRRGRGKRRDDP